MSHHILLISLLEHSVECWYITCVVLLTIKALMLMDIHLLLPQELKKNILLLGECVCFSGVHYLQSRQLANYIPVGSPLFCRNSHEPRWTQPASKITTHSTWGIWVKYDWQDYYIYRYIAAALAGRWGM